MAKQIISTAQTVQVTGISLRQNADTGAIEEMPLSLHVTYDTGGQDEVFYPWASLSDASKQKIAEVLAEVNGLIQQEYL